MPETEVRCTCSGDEGANAACPIHGSLGSDVPGTAAMVVRRMLTRWLRRPELRAAIMEVVIEDARRREPAPTLSLALDGSGKLTLDPCDMVGFAQKFWPVPLQPWQETFLKAIDDGTLLRRRDQVEHLNALHIAAYGEAIGEAIAPEMKREFVQGYFPAARPECRCEHCGWEGDAKALKLGSEKDPARFGKYECLCPLCSSTRVVDLEYEDEDNGPVGMHPRSSGLTIEKLRQGKALLDRVAAAARRKPEATLAAVIGTFRTPPAQAPAQAPKATATPTPVATNPMRTRPVPCGGCGWTNFMLEPDDQDYSFLCGKCGNHITVTPLAAAAKWSPAAPAAACTAHVIAASTMPELTCGACGWQGSASELRQDPGSTSPDEVVCPSCGCDATRDGSVYPTEPADMIGRDVPSPLDQAIRGSTSIDPMGARKPAEQLRVETFEEAEARRKVEAARIAEIMKGGVL